MRKIAIFVILLAMIGLKKADAFVQPKGVLSVSKSDFYYAGLDLYVWSGWVAEKRGNFNSIYKYDLNNRSNQLLITTDCHVGNLALSPSGKFIGVICTRKDKPNSLLIINSRGKKVVELCGSVQEYVWGAMDNELICVTGNVSYPYHGDESITQYTGLWSYDINKQSKTKISEKGGHFISVPFDRHLYYSDDKKSVRYNIDSRKTETSDIQARTDYSPNGRYYVYYLDAEDDHSWESPYWSPFRIYETRIKQELSADRIGFVSEKNPDSIVWGPKSGVIAFSGNRSRTDGSRVVYVFDIESGKLIKQFEGKIVGYSYDRAVLVIYRSGQFYLEKMQ